MPAGTTPMLLTEILNPQCVKVPLEATTKQQAIYELVDLLVDETGIDGRDQLKEAIWERETTRTTGIGFGIAIPHGKTAGCKELMMAIGKPARPLEFGSVDKKPVELILLLASPPDQTGPHITALAAVSQMLFDENIRAEFNAANSPEEVFALIEKHQPR